MVALEVVKKSMLFRIPLKHTLVLKMKYLLAPISVQLDTFLKIEFTRISLRFTTFLITNYKLKHLTTVYINDDVFNKIIKTLTFNMSWKYSLTAA